MIYITGDCHGDFKKLTKKQRNKLPFTMSEEDSLIICGDFGLLWEKGKCYDYNRNWLSSLPFRILWVQGNHENYNMIAEYPLEEWNGGRVRYIVRDKIILLERGQVFQIEGKSFFTMGGASSHDIQGGILDRNASNYEALKTMSKKKKLPYRIVNESWWEQELPDEEELQESDRNLSKNGYKVDYVISHCAANRIQNFLEQKDRQQGKEYGGYSPDILTNYFEKLEDKLQYQHWFFGHYHDNMEIDEKHTLLYEEIVSVNSLNCSI